MENHGQKRSADDQLDVLDGVQAVVLGIDGVTTPITFEQERLFSYLKTNVKSYLASHYEEEECQADLEALRQQASDDKEASVDGVKEIPEINEENKDDVLSAATANILSLMNLGRTTASLKQLQARVLREAYKTGLLQGEVYSDVVPALKKWIDEGKKAYTFSSGSSETQKLLFGYSDKGNILELFSDYFDTTVLGNLNEKDSYEKLSDAVGVKPDEILFFTGVTSEAAVAGKAGLRTVVLAREDGEPLSDSDKQQFLTVSSFSELSGDQDQKAKRTEAEDDEDDDDEDDDIEDVDDDLDDLDGDDVDDAEDGEDDA